jgi:flagellar biosynthesis chaperone FliJ
MTTIAKQIEALETLIAYAKHKVAHWEAKGDEAPRGSRTRHDAWEAAHKWVVTLDTLRDELAAL